MEMRTKRLTAIVLAFTVVLSSLVWSRMPAKAAGSDNFGTSLIDSVLTTYIDTTPSVETEDNTFNFTESINSLDNAAGITVGTDDDNNTIYSIKNAEGLLSLAIYTNTHYTDGMKFIITSVDPIELDNNYIGIGSKLYPFKGTITSQWNITIYLNGSMGLFRYLSSTASVFETGNDVSIESSRVIPSDLQITPSMSKGGLAHVLTADASNMQFSLSSKVNISGDIKNNLSTNEQTDFAASGMLFGKIINSNTSVFDISIGENAVPGGITCATAGDAGSFIGQIIGNVSVSINDSKVLANDSNVIANAGNAGGLIGAINGNVILNVNNAVVGVTSVTSHGGNAGGVVGEIYAGNNFTVSGDIKTDTSGGAIIAYKYGDNTGNSGGLIGSIGEDCNLTVDNFSVSNNSYGIGVFGGSSAGGIIGSSYKAEINCNISKNITAKNVTVAGNTYNGGYIGIFTPKTDITISNNINIEQVTICPLSSQNFVESGGMFGYVNAKEKTVVIDFSDDNTSTLTCQIDTSKLINSGTNINFGGLIGEIRNNKTDVFRIVGQDSKDKITVTSKTAGGTVTIGSCGGVIGKIYDNSYVEISGVATVATYETFATSTATSAGFVGRVNNGAVLVTNNSYTSHMRNTNNLKNNAVFIGYTGHGSVVELSGKLEFTGTNNVESIVKYQDDSLIFAKDSNFKLSRSGKIVGDDIGNYGQIINNQKLNEMISLDNTTHEVIIDNIKNVSPEIIISSLEDFAKLAITISSHGYFNTFGSTLSLNNLTVSINTDIDLTGTGIESLTQVSSTENDINITIEGNNHSIKLDIGAFYKDTNSNYDSIRGIYSHNLNANTSLGLLSSVNNCTFDKLTIGGKITVMRTLTGYDDNEIKRPENDGTTMIYAGALCGIANGEVNITSCTVNTEVLVWRDSGNGRESYYGGFIGKSNGNNNINITNSTCEAELLIKYNGGNIPVIGGFIGEVTNLDSKVVDLSNSVSNAKINDLSTGTISQNEYAGLHIGGIIGMLTSGTSKVSTRSSVILNGNTVGGIIDLHVNNESIGGLLGFSWVNADVSIKNTTINGTVKNNTNCSESKISGLLYELRGKMTVDGDSTTIKGTYISTGKNSKSYDGLFVCMGEELYFVLNDTSGKFITMLKNGINNKDLKIKNTRGSYFDLLVGNNIKSKGTGDIAKTGGIVTIQTSGKADDIGKIPTDDSWYIYSKDHQNPNTRYYTNIDALSIEAQAKTTISSSSDLMLWHLIRYVNRAKANNQSSNLLKEFNLSINDEITLTNDINMTGYCFYPTSTNTANINLNSHKLTFGMPTGDNALAAISDSNHQMYMLQTGIMLDTQNFSISNGSLSGTVNNWENGSGALITGTIAGNFNSKNNSWTQANINITDVILDKLTVRAADSDTSDYMPLLINTVGSHVNADINSLKQKNYLTGSKAGTSLIGNTGANDAEKLTFNFNNIVFKGDKTDTIFTKASLFNSIKYVVGTSSFVYNFNLDEDWKGESHFEQVTYGSELTKAKTEYYDCKIYVSPNSNNKTDEPEDFSSYIPYVRDTQGYSVSVNIKSDDLIDGWGTHAHPYIIRTSGQLFAIYNLINNGLANTNWKVNFPNLISSPTNYSSYSVSSSELTDNLTLLSGSGKDRTLENVRSWFQQAYFVIDSKEINLQNYDFTGIGNEKYPFRGCIIGKGSDSTKIIMPSKSETETLSNWGLIGTANGCVVKGITIEYDANGKYKVAENETTTSYFGGLIGRITSGDNIIDDVALSDLSTANLTVTKKAVFVGGYVGYINGGGLIFRNMSGNLKSGITGFSGSDFYDYFYANPYVGRVLDGYVIDQTENIDNTDKNYTIPYIAEGEVSISAQLSSSLAYTININSAKELFVFAAAVNSGSLSLNSSKYYEITTKDLKAGYPAFRYGDYSDVGDENSPEMISDDGSSLTSVPFLASMFTDTNVKSINTLASSTSKNIIVSLSSDENYDMSVFKNGFRGIGGEYSDNKYVGTTKYIDTSRVHITEFNGNNSTIKLEMNRKQYMYNPSLYKAEPFYSNQIGLFNCINVNASYNNIVIKNINISGNVEIGIYYTGVNYSTDKTFNTLKCINNGQVLSAGGVVGRMYMDKNDTSDNSYTFNSVKLNNLNVTSQDVAGGIVGFQNDGSHSNKNSSELTLFYDCGYSDINITGRSKAGGFLGFGSNIRYMKVENNPNNNIVLNKSNILVSRSNAAGAFDNAYRLNDIAAGGVIGFCYGNSSSSAHYLIVKNISIQNFASVTFSNGATQSRNAGAGGIVGRADWISFAADGCNVSDGIIVSGCYDSKNMDMSDSSNYRYKIPNNIESLIMANPFYNTQFKYITNNNSNLSYLDFFKYLIGRLSYNYGISTSDFDGNAGGVIGGYGNNSSSTTQHSAVIKSCNISSSANGIMAIGANSHAAGLIGEIRSYSPVNINTNDAFGQNYGRKYALMVDGCNVNTKDKGTILIDGGARSGGVSGYCKRVDLNNSQNIYVNNTNVGGNQSSSYIMATVVNYDYSGSIAGGIFGEILTDSISTTATSSKPISKCVIENTYVTNAVIAGSTVGGIAASLGGRSVLQSYNVFICNNSTVNNCFIYSNSLIDTKINSGCSSPGGIVGTVRKDSCVYLNSCMVLNSRLERAGAGRSGFIGGFVGTTFAKSQNNSETGKVENVVTANKLTWSNNTMGEGSVAFANKSDYSSSSSNPNSKKITYSGLLEFSPITSVDNINNNQTLNTFESLYKSDALSTTNNAGLILGCIGDTAHPKILGFSRIDNSENPIAYQSYANKTDDSTAEVCYSNFNSFLTDPDALSPSNNFTKPEYTVSGITFIGDTVGKDHESLTDKNSTIINTPNLMQNLSDNIWKSKYNDEDGKYPFNLKNYSEFDDSAIGSLANLPLFEISGGVDKSVQSYINMLTNGGFDSWNISDISITSKLYSVSESGSVSFVDGSYGSVVQTSSIEKSFKNGPQYDKIKAGENNTFTVISVSFTNKQSNDDSDITTYTLDIPVYYKKIMNMSSYVNPIGSETYQISKFINSNSYTTDINAHGLFTAYIEYAFSEERLDNTDWNFDKLIYSQNESGLDSTKARVFPVGTKLTLIDLNASSSGKYYSYYLELTKATKTLSINSFKRMDGEIENGVEYKALADLPFSSPGYSIKQKSDNDSNNKWGIERYLLVANLPENDNVNNANDTVYHLFADVSDSHNVDLRRERRQGAVTVWPETEVNVTSKQSKKTVLSTTEVVEGYISPTVSYTPGYQLAILAVNPELVHYGIIQYQIRDTTSAGEVVPIPENTRVSLLNSNGEIVDSKVVRNSVSVGNLMLDGNMLNSPPSGEQYTVQLDFSNVDATKFNTSFSKDKYNLYLDFCLTESAEYPESGIKASLPPISLSRQVADSVHVAVNVKSNILNLGVNNHITGEGDTPNNNSGDIDFEVDIGLEKYNGIKDAKLRLILCKKENGAYADPISSTDINKYLTKLLPEESKDQVGTDNIVQEYDITDKLGYDGTYNHLFSMKINKDNSEYSNYMVKAELTYKDSDGNTKPLYTGHFIYTYAKINTSIAN